MSCWRRIKKIFTLPPLQKMQQKYGWKLKDVRINKKQEILKVDCIFEGEQTSFEDSRYDD